MTPVRERPAKSIAPHSRSISAVPYSINLDKEPQYSSLASQQHEQRERQNRSNAHDHTSLIILDRANEIIAKPVSSSKRDAVTGSGMFRIDERRGAGTQLFVARGTEKFS